MQLLKRRLHFAQRLGHLPPAEEGRAVRIATLHMQPAENRAFAPRACGHEPRGFLLERAHLIQVAQHDVGGAIRRLARRTQGLGTFPGEHRSATQALRAHLRERRERAAARRHAPHGAPGEEALLDADACAEDRLEDAEQRLLELVVDVVLRIDRQLVLHGPDRVLSLLVRRSPGGTEDEDVRHPLADLRGERGVALAHLLGQLHVHLLPRVSVRAVPDQRLRDHEAPRVHAALPELGDRLLDIGDGSLRRPLPQQQPQAAVHDLSHELAPVPAHSLDALGVELPGLIRLRPCHAGVPLLVH
mmetsp:Transcript_131002/g.379015  ORF Transcript_131002/g.379015 Transcript_131002/m.379015 type:complete len:302 (+) Transcript_131002:89-994(+)